MARNFKKFFHKSNRFGCGNRFARRGNRFRRGLGNGFGNKGVESSRQKHDCYNCKEEGHFIGECPKSKENKMFIRGAWSDSENDNEPQKDATCHGDQLSREFKKSSVVLDNMLSCQKLPQDKEGLGFSKNAKTTSKEYDGGHVVFRRNLKVKVNSGVKFTKMECTISKNGKTLAKGHRRNGLYTCKLGDNSKQQICLGSMVDKSMLCHRRLGYVNMRTKIDIPMSPPSNLGKLGLGDGVCDVNQHVLNAKRVAIGYKNPLCLTRAKQVQPALYNGHEIIKDNHTLAIVHNSEDTLEIAKITRKKMNDKMNDPELFCVATNTELNVARFTEMHVANTTAETRCLALEAELANLRETNNHDNQKELINHFSKLEVSHLNLQLKYQNLKDRIGNNPPTPDKHTHDFDSVFVIGKMQASLQGKDNVIRQLKKQLSQLQVTRSDTDRTLQHYKELYDSIKITRAKHIEQVTKLTAENMIMKTCVSKATVNPQVFTQDKHAIDVEPVVPRLRNNRDTHLDYLRHLKESVETIRDIVEEAKVVRP
nr:hypothetical protein [Tanacetum cinerariifolium]